MVAAMELNVSLSWAVLLSAMSFLRWFSWVSVIKKATEAMVAALAWSIFPPVMTRAKRVLARFFYRAADGALAVAWTWLRGCPLVTSLDMILVGDSILFCIENMCRSRVVKSFGWSGRIGKKSKAFGPYEVVENLMICQSSLISPS